MMSLTYLGMYILAAYASGMSLANGDRFCLITIPVWIYFGVMTIVSAFREVAK